MKGGSPFSAVALDASAVAIAMAAIAARRPLFSPTGRGAEADRWHVERMEPRIALIRQRYNAAGAPQGAQFMVNTTTLDDQTGPDVAMDSAGNFVVVWSSAGQSGPGFDIYARRYSAAGAALSGTYAFEQRRAVSMNDR